MRGFFPPPAIPGVPFSQQHIRFYAVPVQTPMPVVVRRAQPITGDEEQYSWQNRTERLKWPVAESLEVDQIARKCDLTSALFYTKQFSEARVDDSDLENFGSKGALNAFRILQLGAEYLMKQVKQPVPQPPVMVPSEQYNRMMETATKEIQARDMRIHEYEEAFKQMQEELRQAETLIQKYKRKLKDAKESDSEPGIVIDDILEPDPDQGSGQSSLSDGEIDTTAVAGRATQISLSSDDEY